RLPPRLPRFILFPYTTLFRSTAFGPDGASVGFDESLADGQSETGAARMLLSAMSRAVETLEDVWQLVGGDARSIVRNRYDNYIISLVGGDTDFALTIDQRVRDQILEYNFYARTVHVYQGQIAGDLHRYRGICATKSLDDLLQDVLY